MTETTGEPEEFADKHECATATALGMSLTAEEAFNRLVYMCVPPKTYGQVRLGQATHRRFIATVWVVCPEVFEGMSQAEMGETLGMSEDRFKKLCGLARSAIHARKRATSP